MGGRAGGREGVREGGREGDGKEFHVTFNDKKTTGMVFRTSNVNCKAIQVNGNNVDWVSNAKHLGNVVDDKLTELKDINAKKVILLQVLTGLLATSEAKCLLNVIFVYFSHTAVPIMDQFYGHYMRGFNYFCVTWNKGVRRMLNISNMKHTALLGQLINTCHIYIQLVKRSCKFVDLMLTSRNAIVRHFVRRAIFSAQSPICRNIAVIRHRYAIHVIDINVKHVHRQYPLSHPELSGTVRCILELLCISNNENELPGFSKSDVDTMINALCTC